jgi:4-hydroxybenzoate polyprenyltransferase
MKTPLILAVFFLSVAGYAESYASQDLTNDSATNLHQTFEPQGS